MLTKESRARVHFMGYRSPAEREDSNPRTSFPVSILAGCCDRPLCHLSEELTIPCSARRITLLLRPCKSERGNFHAFCSRARVASASVAPVVVTSSIRKCASRAQIRKETQRKRLSRFCSRSVLESRVCCFVCACARARAERKLQAFRPKILSAIF